MAELLAWVIGNDEEAEVVFAGTEEEARDASRCLGDVERAERLDRFSPGPVSKADLLADGWWFSCGYCGHHVSEDGCETCADLRESEEVEDPVIDGDEVYCSTTCKDADEEERRLLRESESRARAEAERRWPGVVIESCWPSTDLKALVRLRFPGGQGVVEWRDGEDTATVERRDVDAWNVFAERCTAERASSPAREESKP